MFTTFERVFGIDLGTSNTVIFERGKGVVLNEPSVVARYEETGDIAAVGSDAQAMIGRTPANVAIEYPLRSGVIANFEMTSTMLRQFMKRIRGRSSFFRSAQVYISVPCGITNVQKRAVEETIVLKGAKKAVVVEEPLAAAIGAGLPVHEPIGHMVFNVGGGTSQAAILSMGGIVASRTTSRAGRALDLELMEYVKRAHNVEIGERTAEELKIRIGTADASAEGRALEIRGRDVVNGLPRSIRLTSDELLPIVDDFAAGLVNTIRATLELCPPELAGDVVEQGILLCGGVSLLRGIDERIRADTGVPVHLAERPQECAAIGTGMML